MGARRRGRELLLRLQPEGLRPRYQRPALRADALDLFQQLRSVRLQPDHIRLLRRGRAGQRASRLRMPEVSLRSYSAAPAASKTFLGRLPSRHAPTLLIPASRIARYELTARNRSARLQAIGVGMLRRSARCPHGRDESAYCGECRIRSVDTKWDSQTTM